MKEMVKSLRKKWEREDEFLRRTPRVIYKHKATLDKRQTIYKLARLGSVEAMTLGSNKKAIGIHSICWSKGGVDVRLASDELNAILDDIHRQIVELEEKRKQAIKDHFYDTEELTWDKIKELKKGYVDEFSKTS